MKPLLFLFIAAVYIACFLWVGGYGAFWSEDAGVKYLQAVNLIRSRWTDAAIGYPGRSIDPRLEFNPLAGTHTFVRDGRIYSIYPVAFSFLSSLLYARLGFPGLYLLPVLSTLAMIGLVYKTGRLILGARGAAVATLVAAFSCPTFFYAFTFWEMNVAAFMLMGGMCLVIRDGGAARPWAALSMAPAFYDKEFFSARSPRNLSRLVELLREKRRKGFVLMAENDPSIIDAVAAHCYLMPRRVEHVRMKGDDYFQLIMAEYGLE